MGKAHQAGQQGFRVRLAVHPGLGFLMLAGIEAQLQGQEVGARRQFFLGLEVLRAAFFLAVLERVERGTEQPVWASLARELQGGHRFQVAHRALCGLMPRQAVASEQQQLVKPVGIHALQLRQQVVPFAVLARKVRQGRHG
ncbi:hypothetical protein D3C80_1635540 [compost metagenome]